MIDRLRSTKQGFGLAAALAVMLSVAGPTTSGAAPSNASGTGYVNGMPCNDICKAYLAWSDRMMAKLRSSPQSRSKARVEARVAVRRSKPERIVHAVPEKRRSDLDSFARILRPSDTAPQAPQPPQIAVAAPSGPADTPVDAIEQRLSPAAGVPNARLADASSASTEPPERTLVSLTAPIAATQDRQDTQDTSTSDDFARGSDWLLRGSLGLALCALLLLLYWGWFRDKTQGADRLR